MSVNTIGKSWIVTQQFHKSGERFAKLEEAELYASVLTKKVLGERVEIFECTKNYFIDLPLTVVSVADTDNLV